MEARGWWRVGEETLPGAKWCAEPSQRPPMGKAWAVRGETSPGDRPTKRPTTRTPPGGPARLWGGPNGVGHGAAQYQRGPVRPTRGNQAGARVSPSAAAVAAGGAGRGRRGQDGARRPP